MGLGAARYRAARAYAGLDQSELAAKLQVDRKTIIRRESDDPDEYQPAKRGEKIAVAQICGVPLDFLEEGFGGRAPSETSERLDAIDQALAETDRTLLGLANLVAALVERGSQWSGEERRRV